MKLQIDLIWPSSVFKSLIRRVVISKWEPLSYMAFRLSSTISNLPPHTFLYNSSPMNFKSILNASMNFKVSPNDSSLM